MNAKEMLSPIHSIMVVVIRHRDYMTRFTEFRFEVLDVLGVNG